jgi:integrase/recombinase XerC
VTPTLPQAVDAFVDYLRDVRQLSANTISAYRRDLVRLQQHCEQASRLQLVDIRDSDIRQWVAGMHRAGLSGASIQRALSAARALFRWLTARHPELNDPVQHVRAPRRGRKLPTSLEPDAVDAMLSPEANDPLEIRDLAMAELIYSSGLRLQELVDLDLQDLQRDDATVTVTGKGRKTRTVPVGQAAITAIDRWLQVRREQGEQPLPSSPLFVSQRGQRISHRSVQARFARLAASGRLAQPLHPHMLRHAFASHMLESSGDLRAVQELLGHSNIGTTQIYTHLDFQHLAKTYDAAHPRAQRQKKS